MSRVMRHRHFWPISIAVVTIALTVGTFPAYAAWTGQFHGGTSTTAGPKVVDESKPHSHTDPATKNAISRAPASAETADPTTALAAVAGVSGVEAQRLEADPTLVKTASPPARTSVPQDRYAMAGGCYALQSKSNSKWVARAGSGYTASGETISAAEPFHFQATDLGTYLLFGKPASFLGSGGAAIKPLAKPSAASDWTVQRVGTAFTFTLPASSKAVSVGADGKLQNGDATAFALKVTTGCEAWPEVDVNVTGNPFGGKTSYQEVRGYVDAHTHGMAFEFLGGSLHCGRPWHPYGVAAALVDCPDHSLTGGSGAVVENFLKGGVPVAPHDTVGWPTFKDWPAPNSLTHEGTYYKWLERSWRGGQRILVNLLVENNQLCTIYPLKRNSCDDMTSMRLQAADMRKLERYIDAQNGGPGKGWYRIVGDPFEARKVINQGKLAVVMGMETSVPFGCSTKLGVPQCTAAEIDQQLDDVFKMGVRQVELVNKFDNALSGVAGDGGTIGPLVNGANFLETGSFWDMRKCTDPDPEVSDNPQPAAPDVIPEQDALFGAVASLGLPIKLPLYGSGPHCNALGLTTLGDHTIAGMAKRHMLFDPDHMSVNARKQSLDATEKLKYPGVVSSHSWSTPDAYPRIYKAGGMITPYAGDSAGFVNKWKKHLTWADSRYYFGIGYGADINGLGAQGDPRGADAPNKVTYPFKGLGGVTIDKQVSGERVYDINVDGVSHYGLYPDWIEDLRKQGGAAIADDMARGSEAYLDTWERAQGVTNDACRDPKARKFESVFNAIKKGTSVKSVLLKAGQPHSRLSTKFTYCAKTKSGKKVTRAVYFSSKGTVTKVT
ncbi:hypothetical protein J2X11_002412 [Aeromicrobium panaciterrae]|uniref:Peptidase n=1 Tax=Aeromicrobium panaciterrae TaxID=363861 RepID=A0ABU1UQV4_9ACTN|nr:hypothetical protein [Aeromicrobium panaciterrae]MDR7087573.1 hypothetical protein [Aeromicrobium panaciterrae]